MVELRHCGLWFAGTHGDDDIGVAFEQLGDFFGGYHFLSDRHVGDILSWRK
jgi:hypothetical protein